MRKQPSRGSKKAPSKASRQEEPKDAAGAAKLFEERTGIALATDPIFKRAVLTAVEVTIFDSVIALDRWAKRLRTTLALVKDPPAAPDVITKLPAELGISPELRMQGKSHEGEPVDVDFVGLPSIIADRVDELRRTLDALETFGKALREKRLDRHDREGRFVEDRGAHRPTAEDKLRFTRRLDHEWRTAGRPDLGPTELGLAAVYLGLESLAGGLVRLTDRWAAQLRRDRALTKKRLAAGERRLGP